MFADIIDKINSVLWDKILIYVLLGVGIFFTIKLKFVQVRKFGESFKSTFGNMKLHGKSADKKGMSSFQSLATAIAAQIGTGNLVGIATAIVAGGAGAIFWMWVSGFFGMATIYVEASLAQKYKKEVDGEIVGGPVYYIRGFFKGKFGKFLAGFFAISITIALGFMGNMVQANSIGESFHQAFGANTIAVCVIVAVLAGIVFLGGVKRIASITEKIVPVMALLYIVGALVVIGMNYQNIGNAFAMIFKGAFSVRAAGGAMIGITMKEAMRYGIARGLFSNEAGMGSTPHAHALAKVEHPCKQGSVAIMGVFFDTFIVLTITALVILTSDSYGTGLDGVALTQGAFAESFGKFGEIFIAICLFFFAFSTIIAWYFFGESNVKYLFGKKAVKFYAVIVMGFIILGAFPKVSLAWALSDLFNGLMVLPNVLALVCLSGEASKLMKEYEQSEKALKIAKKAFLPDIPLESVENASDIEE